MQKQWSAKSLTREISGSNVSFKLFTCGLDRQDSKRLSTVMPCVSGGRGHRGTFKIRKWDNGELERKMIAYKGGYTGSPTLFLAQLLCDGVKCRA